MTLVIVDNQTLDNLGCSEVQNHFHVTLYSMF